MMQRILPGVRYAQTNWLQQHLKWRKNCVDQSFIIQHLSKWNVHQQFSTKEHWNSTEQWLNKYPVLTDTKIRPSVYILDHELAGLIVEKLGGRNLSNEKAAWVEVNPGPGVVTRALLEAGLPRLIAIERQDVFNPELEDIMEAFPGRLTYINKHFFSHPFIGDKYYELLQLMPDFSAKSFLDDPPLKIICHPAGHWLYEKKFSRTLQHQLVRNKDSIYSQGRVQFITIVSGVEHMNLTPTFPSKTCYRIKNVLQHLLFDTESLLKVPTEYLYPMPLMKTYKDEKFKKYKKEPFVLLRMTPKWNLFEQVVPAEYLGLFQFFLKEMLVKKTARLIPNVDTWFPGRGLDLIKSGYAMTDTVRDTTPDDLLKVFETMLTWPELHSSSFYSEYYGQESHRKEERHA
ncbi:dimethyladenosine transferase 2, mitochondrial-like [Lineus longissimus]|uniref:dimethyladenosine transferase 2, mitochondrial-like n=1 Tax=Lineus longissimus TaxID=88925 RepID=UPI002B4C2F93